MTHRMGNPIRARMRPHKFAACVGADVRLVEDLIARGAIRLDGHGHLHYSQAANALRWFLRSSPAHYYQTNGDAA